MGSERRPWQEMLAMAWQPTMMAFLVSLAAIEFVRAALFITLLPVYLPERLRFSAAAVGGVHSAQYVADTLLRMWVGSMIDRMGAWPVMLPGFALTAGFALAATMLPLIVSQHSLWQALPPVMLLVCANAMILPAWNGLMTSSVPHERRGGMMRFFMTVEGVGLALGPPLGGVLTTTLGSRLRPPLCPYPPASLVPTRPNIGSARWHSSQTLPHNQSLSTATREWTAPGSSSHPTGCTLRMVAGRCGTGALR
jgi:MFS family permease